MNPSLPLITLAIAALLSGCDSPEPTTGRRGIHEATATVQIFPSPGLPRSERFPSNQIAILQSDSIQKSCPEATASALEIRIIEGTDLLAVTAHHDEEGMPQAIVQAVLDSYLEHRQILKTEALKTLEEAIVAQKKVMEKRREERDKHIVTVGIPYLDGDHPSPMGASEEDMLQRAAQKLAEYETFRDQVKIQIKKLNERSGNDLIRYAAGLYLPENQVTFYYTKHRESLEQLQALRAQGLGKSHPEILESEEQAKTSLKNAAKEAVSLKPILKIKLDLINRQVDRMKEMLSGEYRTEQEERNRKGSTRLTKYIEANDLFQEAQESLQRLRAEQTRRVLRDPNIPVHISRSLLIPPRDILIIHGWDHQ